MKKYRFKIVLLLVAITSLIALSGCGSSQGGNVEVTYTIIGPSKEDYILKDYEIKVKEDTSVFEGLAIACKENKIPMSSTGGKTTAYVQGINSIFEFDEGPESGWLYRVNGEFLDKSSGAVDLTTGDIVEWVYTKKLGNDWK